MPFRTKYFSLYYDNLYFFALNPDFVSLFILFLHFIA